MMQQFNTITVSEAHARLQQDDAVLVDIRDAQNFHAAHARNAIHLTDAALNDFMQQVDFEQPIFVMCYHGISSQGAAQYLVNQGFEHTYSIDGGFEAWQRDYPQEVISG
jgi:thiosulfate sulfurtransferase